MAQTGDIMRHVPPLDWLRGLVGQYRQQCNTIFEAVRGRAPVSAAEDLDRCERTFRGLAKALDCLTEAAGKHRHGGPDDLRPRVDRAFADALAALDSLDPVRFRTRRHFNEFRRSEGEIVWAAVLTVGDHMRRVIQAAAAVEPGVHELLLAGLVLLTHPVNEETLRPIA